MPTYMYIHLHVGLCVHILDYVILLIMSINNNDNDKYSIDNEEVSTVQ